MVKLGKTLKYTRTCLKLSQREMAERLGISNVHLCNIENNEVSTSLDLVNKFHEAYGVNLYVFAWLLHGDTGKLPESVRASANKLANFFKKELENFSLRKGIR